MLNETIKSVIQFCPFITKFLIVCPEKDKALLNLNYNDKSFDFIFDDEIEVKNTNHAYYNYHLRTKAALSDKLDCEFIMSDDDYRPLRPINLDYYKKDEKYNSYYFYDLEYWPNVKSSYDQCLNWTYKVLLSANYPTLAFSSHMPQIVNKEIYLEAARSFKSVSYGSSLCDWSTYFNYAIYHYPELFNEPLPYASLNWPDYHGIWPRYVINTDYYFENYYPFLYDKNDLYEALEAVSNKGNWEALLEIKIQKVNSFWEDGILPYMSYRRGLFRVFYPALNKIYQLYCKLYKRNKFKKLEGTFKVR